MKHGPLVFLGAFFALAVSWCGLVLAPQIQIGRDQQTNTVNSAELYPVARPGLARQGAEVYRANGCAACHTQQVRQSGTVCDVLLTDAGTNTPALLEVLRHAGLGNSEPGKFLTGLPKPVKEGLAKNDADSLQRQFKEAGAKSQVRIRPVGPDITGWGWGPRRNVAEDYLYDEPVMLGSLRVGPDLANIGLRRPDPNWQLRHLYDPRSQVNGSIMPSYKFLFHERRLQPGESPAADAVPLTARGTVYDVAKDTGAVEREAVPTPEAQALVAYLVSLRSDAVLFETPMTAPSAKTAGANARAK